MYTFLHTVVMPASNAATLVLNALRTLRHSYMHTKASRFACESLRPPETLERSWAERVFSWVFSVVVHVRKLPSGVKWGDCGKSDFSFLSAKVSILAVSRAVRVFILSEPPSFQVWHFCTSACRLLTSGKEGEGDRRVSSAVREDSICVTEAVRVFNSVSMVGIAGTKVAATLESVLMAVLYD